jgi:hypothetical protein
MDKNIVIFDKIPQPRTVNDHQNIQASLVTMEEQEHQMIEIQKGIEVMDKFKDENQFILNALQER